MNSRNDIRLIHCLLGLLLLAACTGSDELPAGPSGQTHPVPVSFVVQSAGPVPTRAEGEDPAVDNDLRPLYVDKVQVNLYRRPAGTYQDDRDGFTFDQAVTLPVSTPAAGGPTDYRYATGTLPLADGYEYRTTALAFAEARGEGGLFTLTGSGPFADATVSLTDQAQCRTPELFFGTPRYGGNIADKESGAELFTYRKGDMLCGWLYRCVAGIGLELTNVPADVSEIALLSGTMNTTSGATAYADFLSPGTPQTATEAERSGRFELMAWTRPAGATGSQDVTLRGGNLLPVSSRLSVRFIQGGVPHVTTLRMQPGTDPSLPDLAEGRVTFQRNHYYRIRGAFNDLATQGLTLTLTVNPNWAGDADLSLGEE